MAIDYDRMRAVAERLIRENGAQTATLERAVPGNYDPLTDNDDSEAPLLIPCSVVLTSVNTGKDAQDIERLPGRYAIGELSKALVAADDLPAGFTPLAGDWLRLTDPVMAWKVEGTNTVRPDATAILHKLYIVRKAGAG